MNNSGFVLGLAALAAFLYSKPANSGDSKYAGEIESGAESFSVDASNVSSWENGDIIGGLMDSINYISDDGLEKLKQREGFSAIPYADHKGFSIGYGHLIKPGEDLTLVDINQATGILNSDVQWAVDTVLTTVKVPLTQNQFDALVSFCFNVGRGAFSKSTLVKRINAGDANAFTEFSRWVYASGSENVALVNRRIDETNQFIGA